MNKKMLFHTKGTPSRKDLVLVDGLNEYGEKALDICAVGHAGIFSSVVTQIKAWVRIKDVRRALTDYQKYCAWRPYPANKPSTKQRYQWFLVACRSKSIWRKDKIVFDTDTWDGERFAMTNDSVLYYLPIVPAPKI